MVRDHPTHFGGPRHSGSGDINIPTNMVISPQIWNVTSMNVYARLLPILSFYHGMPCFHRPKCRLTKRLQTIIF